MTRSRPLGRLAAAVALPLVALAIASCGSNGGTSSSGGTSSTPAPTSTPATPSNGSGATSTAPTPSSHATVSLATTPLGKILVDSKGMTLYLWQKDTGSKSACTGACAAAWPPLRASGKPTAGSGVQASLLGTTPRSDGQPEVTYNGHPLYGFQGDSKPGDTNGQGSTGFGAPWYVVSASGKAITTAP